MLASSIQLSDSFFFGGEWPNGVDQEGRNGPLENIVQ